MNARTSFCLLIAAFAVTGCSSLPTEHFAGSTPIFDPMAYFAGKTHSWGVFEKRSGQPSKRFRTDAIGRREGDALLLDQKFTYEDGRIQRRHWRIRRVDAHRFEATADDVVGTAVGEAYGNAFHWEYTVALAPGNPLMNVRLKQWMYLQDGGRVMVNRGSINKLGVELAQVTEYFRRE